MSLSKRYLMGEPLPDGLTVDEFKKMQADWSYKPKLKKHTNSLNDPKPTSVEEDMIDRLGYENCVNDESWSEGL